MSDRLPPSLQQVTASHLEQAALQWPDDGRYGSFHPSRDWDVLIGGKPYPPIAVTALAHDLAGLGALTPRDLSTRAGRHPLHDFLRKRGFSVVPKDAPLPHVVDREQADSVDGDDGRLLALHQDVVEIEQSSDVETTKRQLIDARLGQGKFRRDLEEHWGGACAVTKVTVRAALRAGHIHPWADSDNVQRLDPHNGLLLVATLDALFDQGLISFADDGTLLVHPEIEPVQAQLLDLHRPGLRLRTGPGLRALTDERRAYLAQHRERYEYPNA